MPVRVAFKIHKQTNKQTIYNRDHQKTRRKKKKMNERDYSKAKIRFNEQENRVDFVLDTVVTKFLGSVRDST